MRRFYRLFIPRSANPFPPPSKTTVQKAAIVVINAVIVRPKQ
ncbi:hypothetical protein SPAB_02387 [Salmonella enterica subsp. enterica serovar Paratyphi B str. SPB7]|uniref:Uncharacterized protein n=1 Tax=Salmonella paratyphi B (strain ATCC BAA-1250 / SPB7) TaxID=1016998 RepID=A0A6C6Z3A6_SALPB|nr:hypothetical protein SPAB_02387 [Salmonella enterica subsp. enterica serovar Paratyphi B str. SPB7]